MAKKTLMAFKTVNDVYDVHRIMYCVALLQETIKEKYLLLLLKTERFYYFY